eukprot:scaffold1048_cov90-Amphora_coffeaeformis.AAC.10
MTRTSPCVLHFTLIHHNKTTSERLSERFLPNKESSPIQNHPRRGRVGQSHARCKGLSENEWRYRQTQRVVVACCGSRKKGLDNEVVAGVACCCCAPFWLASWRLSVNTSGLSEKGRWLSLVLVSDDTRTEHERQRLKSRNPKLS